MYTEISHFLLLVAIYFSCLWFICLVVFGAIWICVFWLYYNIKVFKKKQHIRSYNTIADSDESTEVQQNCRPKQLVQLKALFGLVGINISNIEQTPKKLSFFFLILTGSFFGTLCNFVCSDFTVYNILTNSTADVPLFYKISATWSNHEGSLLLWCWLLSFNIFILCISICVTKMVRFSSPKLLRHHGWPARFNQLNRQPEKTAGSLLPKDAQTAHEAPKEANKQSLFSKRSSATVKFRTKRDELKNQLSQKDIFFYESAATKATRNLYKSLGLFTNPFMRAFKSSKPFYQSIALLPKISDKLISNSHQNSPLSSALLSNLRFATEPKCNDDSQRAAFVYNRSMQGSAGLLVERARLAKGTFYQYESCNTDLYRLYKRLGLFRASAFLKKDLYMFYKKPFDNIWMTYFQSTASLHFFRDQMLGFNTVTAFTAGGILIFFTTFCVYTSNPFLRTSIPSINSLAELNPILQDPVLAIHPPCIYAGYVASAIAFSLCMSSFFERKQTR